jgi:hypothetical protein
MQRRGRSVNPGSQGRLQPAKDPLPRPPAGYSPDFAGERRIPMTASRSSASLSAGLNSTALPTAGRAREEVAGSTAVTPSQPSPQGVGNWFLTVRGSRSGSGFSGAGGSSAGGVIRSVMGTSRRKPTHSSRVHSAGRRCEASRCPLWSGRGRPAAGPTSLRWWPARAGREGVDQLSSFHPLQRRLPNRSLSSRQTASLP